MTTTGGGHLGRVTLAGLLAQVRAERGFDVEWALLRKLERINGYFVECGLDAAVIGVSGGVDSALVLSLFMAASRVPRSPIKRVVALQAPVTARGATGQERATDYGRRAIDAAAAESWHAELAQAQRAYVAAFSGVAHSDAWSEGQLLSVVRTPALYYAAALLQAEGFRSIVVGTTNRDEGAYLGFFGKASDAMVDMQPVSDLHKSEVRLLARRLGVPQDIVERAPSGDVYDAKDDEVMIGAPYWAVELYLALLCRPRQELIEGLCALERAQWQRYSSAITRLHQKNVHKYRVGSPAVHLDVYERHVPGGW